MRASKKGAGKKDNNRLIIGSIAHKYESVVIRQMWYYNLYVSHSPKGSDILYLSDRVFFADAV